MLCWPYLLSSGVFGVGVGPLVKPCCRDAMADLYRTDCVTEVSASDHTVVPG